MMMRTGLILSLSVCLQAQQRFVMELPDLYPAAKFELGGNLRISRQPVKRMVVGFLGRVDLHDVEIQINGHAVDTTDTGNEHQKLFEVSARSDLFEQGKVTIVKAGVRDQSQFDKQWSISRHDSPWAMESLTVKDGGSIRIELERPNRALLAGIDTHEHFLGLLSMQLEPLKGLSVGGVPATLTAKTGRVKFDAKVKFTPDQRVIVIAAEGEKGSASRLHYPLLSTSK